MRKITQQKIAKALNVSQPFINGIMKEKHLISWPMAEKLSNLFPGKSLREWKNATPAELKRAFEQLNGEAA